MRPKNRIQSVKDTYNQIGKEFSNTRKKAIWPDLIPFLNQIPSQSSILDVGCGNGRILRALPEKIKYLGIDISSALLDEAKKQFPTQEFLETDITQEKIWKHLNKYDFVLCIAVFHHLPDKESQLFVLKQIKQHLKPNGHSLITAWNLWQPKYLKYHLNPSIKWQNKYWVEIPFQGKPRFCFAYTKHYLQQLLKEAEIKGVVSQTKQNFLITF